jgi:hypothetical protein
MSNEIMLAVLLLALGGAAVFAWRDLIVPHGERKLRREDRRQRRRRAWFRPRLFADLWNLRKTPRLSDQRAVRDSSSSNAESSG